MRFERTIVLVLAGIIGMAAPSAARGDVASQIQGDLLNAASLVPSPQVTVALPAAGSDAALVSSNENVSVTYSPSIGAPLAGITAPPGVPPLYSTATAEIPVWDLAVLEAVKHSIAAGNAIGSVSITRGYAGMAAGSNPDLLMAAPTYVPFPSTSLTMTDAQVHAAIAQSLPAWAQNANVAVVADAASQRAVTVSLTVPADAFGIFDPGAVLSTVLGDQSKLAFQGADIGRVIVSVTDATSGDPLYTGVGDVTIGFDGAWVSPLVASIAGAVPSPTQVSTQAALSASSVQGATGIQTPTP